MFKGQLKCSLCGTTKDGNRKIVTGSRANICALCTESFRQVLDQQASPVSVQRGNCSFCDKEEPVLERNSRTGTAVRICSGCLQLCHHVVNERVSRSADPVTSAQWRGKSRSPRPQRSLAESKAFYAENIDRLLSTELQASSGELIAELLDIKPSKKLKDYGKQWLSAYWKHEDAPDVIAALLKTDPSREHARIAVNYINDHPNADIELNPIFVTAFKIEAPTALYEAIMKTLERTPQGYVWTTCFAMGTYERTTPETEELCLRWLELNQDNSQMFMLPLAGLPRSQKVSEAIFGWMKGAGRTNKYLPSTLESLMTNAAVTHRELVPDLVSYEREFIQANPQNQSLGNIHAALVECSNLESDLENAKLWYDAHPNDKNAWRVLAGIMRFCRLNGSADMFGADRAKALLAETTIPALSIELVNLYPDEESIAIARRAYLAFKSTSLLVPLLQLSPDDSLIADAIRLLYRDRYPVYQVLVLKALLKADPGRATVHKLAAKWLRENRTHADASSIKALLSKATKRTQDEPGV